ncbi:carboxymuconolactone decarboxylase family protein [Latilactobacillus sakei]
MAKKQTAGRDLLGDFAPKFAELNDDVLFGQVWSRESELPAHQRSLITISALISGGNFEQLPSTSKNWQGKRHYRGRNCRSYHASGLLCGLAKSLVGNERR